MEPPLPLASRGSAAESDPVKKDRLVACHGAHRRNPALLHLKIMNFSNPWKEPSKNSTPSCAGPTVGANCRGFVTADVLSVRT